MSEGQRRNLYQEQGRQGRRRVPGGTPLVKGKRKRKGRQKRPRLDAADYRMAEALCRRAGGNNEVACTRALAERDDHLYRACTEAARRNRAAADDHRRTAERLDRVSELLVEWGGMERPRRGGGRDSGDLLPRREGARLRTGRPRQRH